MNVQSKPNDLSALWMPFTANRQFKKAPRLFVGAEARSLRYERRPARPRRHVGALVRECRPLPPEDRRGDQEAGRDARLRRLLPDGPSARLRSRKPADLQLHRKASSTYSSRTRALKLVETALKMAIAYHRAKGKRHRRYGSYRPRARLPRCQLRRHRRRRHRHQSETVPHCRSPASITCATRTIFRCNAFCDAASRSTALEFADELERARRPA